MKTILSVDAGGTKTRGVLLDEDNHILREAVTGCGNLTLDFADAAENIVSSIAQCISGETPVAVVVGAAGAGSADYAARLQDALEKLFGFRPNVTGCSRTDSGVHAEGYRATFEADTDKECSRICLALNALLPSNQ